MEQEIWRDIPGLDKKAEVSNLGKVRRKDGIPVDVRPDAEGYMRCSICGVRDRIHRFVAKAFCENPEPEIKTMVDHIDGNKKNNRADNLRWVTGHENNIYAAQNGLYNNNCKPMNTPIIAINTDTLEVRIFKSQMQMSHELDIPDCSINKVVKGIRKTAHKWSVEYLNEYNAKKYLSFISEDKKTEYLDELDRYNINIEA